MADLKIAGAEAILQNPVAIMAERVAAFEYFDEETNSVIAARW